MLVKDRRRAGKETGLRRSEKENANDLTFIKEERTRGEEN